MHLLFVGNITIIQQVAYYPYQYIVESLLFDELQQLFCSDCGALVSMSHRFDSFCGRDLTSRAIYRGMVFSPCGNARTDINTFFVITQWHIAADRSQGNNLVIFLGSCLVGFNIRSAGEMENLEIVRINRIKADREGQSMGSMDSCVIRWCLGPSNTSFHTYTSREGLEYPMTYR